MEILEFEDGQLEEQAYVEIEGDNTYYSNENRFKVSYQSVDVSMSSPMKEIK